MDEIDPPRLGMRGNLRVLMVDRDADESAARVQDRFAGQGLWQ